MINSIEYSRCAERKSVWPNFSNFNTDGHSGSFTQLSQPENVCKQYQLVSVSHSSEKLRKIKKSLNFLSLSAGCSSQASQCHSFIKSLLMDGYFIKW